jgi:uncharacterized Zn finger protein (UPF0148 family)
MVAKTCPRCNGTSYSAAEKGKWICPYCDLDISQIPSRGLKEAK